MKLLWVVRLLGALSMLVLPYTGFSHHPTPTSVGGISIAGANETDGDHGDTHHGDGGDDHEGGDEDGE